MAVDYALRRTESQISSLWAERNLNARLCAERPNRKWLWMGYAVESAQWCGFPFLPLSGHFPKTWWRVPRRPSAGNMWPGRSMSPPPGRTGAASSQSWMRMKSPVITLFKPPQVSTLLYVHTKTGWHHHPHRKGISLVSFTMFIVSHPLPAFTLCVTLDVLIQLKVQLLSDFLHLTRHLNSSYTTK